VVALASLTGGCGHAPLDVCNDPPTPEAACITCLNANCSEVVQNIGSDCAHTLACTQKCECGDIDCLNHCNYDNGAFEVCNNEGGSYGEGGSFGVCSACVSACTGVIIHL
jgi:hypothetical protein